MKPNQIEAATIFIFAPGLKEPLSLVVVGINQVTEPVEPFSLTCTGFKPGASQRKGFYWLGHLIDTDDNQGQRLFQPWSKNEDGRGLDLVGFHRALFDNDGPPLYTFVLGAQFAIHRNLLQQKPVSFYERALEVSVSFPDAAHCFERSWDRVFDVVGLDPDWLDGRLTVQLKPMKHQHIG